MRPLPGSRHQFVVFPRTGVCPKIGGCDSAQAVALVILPLSGERPAVVIREGALAVG